MAAARTAGQASGGGTKVTEPTTPTGKRLWDHPDVRADYVDGICGGDILAIEAEAKVQGVAERYEQLQRLLPGLNALLTLDAASFGRIVSERPDVYVVLRAFLVDPSDE